MAKVLYRYLEVSDAPAEGSLKVAFSSETPVLRVGDGVDHKRGEKYWEVLDHQPESADIKLLQNRGSFLDEHDFKRPLGVIESAEICADKMGRAEISFCEDQLSKDRELQLRTKKRPHISFGYVQSRCMSESAGADGVMVKRFAWQAYEISSVAVPADDKVGVGRSFDPETNSKIDLRGLTETEISELAQTRSNKNMKTEVEIAAEQKAAVDAAVATARTETATATRASVEQESKARSTALVTRNAEIRSLANEFVKDHGQKWGGEPGSVFVVGERIRALEMELCNAPADQSAAEVRLDFKRRAMDLIKDARAPKVQQEAAAMPDEIASRCSLRHVYNAAARSKERSPCFIPKDGAERESHDEIHHRAAEFPGGSDCLGEGLIFPINAPSHIRAGDRRLMTRDSLASNFATAGAMIAPEYVFPIIELLRNWPALSKVGMTYLGGVMGNLVLPRQNAATTAQSVAEGAALTAYDQVLGDIKMSPKRVGSHQKYTRLAMLQTTPDFEAFVLQDHLAQIALWIDYMGINGDGAGDQPTGVVNQPGVGSVTFGAAATYAKIMDFETAIRSANVTDPISFITTSTARGKLRLAPETLTGSTVVSGSTNAIWKGGETGSVLDRLAVDTQQVPGNKLIAGAFRHMLFAQWGGLAIVLDTLSMAEYDKYKLSINTYIDFALRHPQAFVVSADSAAQ